MVKIIRRREASDIDLAEPVNSFVMAAHLVFGLRLVRIGPQTKEETEAWIKGQIADFLNLADECGISISKTEAVPAVFSDEVLH